MTLITSIINFKGGVAKTTTTINLAAALTKLKQRVLVIDTDAQGNISTLLGKDYLDQKIITIGKLYEDTKIKPQQAIIKGDYFDYIPNNLFSYQRTNGLSDFHLLSPIINQIKNDYDHILIDTPPHLGFDSINAIFAADVLMIVTDFSKTSMTGVKILVSVLETWHDKSIAKAFKQKPKAILFTMYQASTKINQQLLNRVEGHSEMGLILGEKIPRSVKVVEDGYSGIPTVTRSRNKVALAYKSLAQTWLNAEQSNIIEGEKHTLTIRK